MIKLNKGVLKFPWKCKEPRILKKIMKMSNKAKGLPDQTGIKQRWLEVAS